jgi:hypothetical protein
VIRSQLTTLRSATVMPDPASRVRICGCTIDVKLDTTQWQSFPMTASTDLSGRVGLPTSVPAHQQGGLSCGVNEFAK